MNLSRINLILLVPHGRSGSYLIQSLFDGHDEIAMFPGAHIHYCLGLERFDTSAEIARTFVAEHLHFFDSSRSYFASSEANPVGEAREYFNVDTEAFINTYTDLLDRAGLPSDRIAWICAHLAFARVCDQDISQIRYILIHQHTRSAELSKAYFRDFPGLYYVAPTRDPREEWSSYQKLVRRRFGQIRLFDQFLEFLKSASASRLDLLAALAQCGNGHFKVVDLARLHLLQDTAMKQLAGWLGIAYRSSLVQSTIMGVPWLGNASDQKPIAGFDRDRARSKYREVLSQTERNLAEYFLGGMIEVLGYPPVDQPPLARKEIFRRIFLCTEPIAWLRRKDKKELIDLWCRQSPSKTSPLINCMRLLSRVLPFRMAQRIGYAYLTFADLKFSIHFFLRRYSLQGLKRMESISDQFRRTTFDQTDLI